MTVFRGHVRNSITVVAVGDLQLGDSPTTVGYGFYSRYRGTALGSLFGDVHPLLGRTDILFGNLETMLVPPAAGETNRAALQLRGEPGFAVALRQVGFTVLNVANNHASQHGDDVFRATVQAVTQTGISCCGLRGTDGWTSQPVFAADGAVGILAYCLRPRQYGAEAPPYAEGTVETICCDVRRLCATGATAVISLHWGEEFVPQPSHEEVALGHAIVDAGATLLIGHHPHVTRPIERYKSGLIAYSLGNFMGDMTWYDPFRSGAILRCTLANRHVEQASVHATRLGRQYVPVPAGPGAGELPIHDAISGLDSDTYARQIASTWRRQRMVSQ